MIQLYKTLLRSIIARGAETWPLRKTEENNKPIVLEKKKP